MPKDGILSRALGAVPSIQQIRTSYGNSQALVLVDATWHNRMKLLHTVTFSICFSPVNLRKKLGQQRQKIIQARLS